MSEFPRPVPQAEIALDEQFWAHCNEERLCFQRCRDCDTWRHLPRHMCARCSSPDWEWAESSGRGRVFSWTVTHQAGHPAFASDVPFAVVVVELEEGVRIVSLLRDHPLDAIELGLPVEVFFDRVSDDCVLPVFRPA